MSVDWTSQATAAAALRARGIESDLADADLHKFALAAVAEIAARGLGPRADTALVVYGSGSLITLSPPASAVASVTEEGVSLTAGTHYVLRPGGIYLERIVDGYPSRWVGRVTLTASYAAADDRYDRVVVDLVKLALEYSGLEARRDGDYSEEAKGARSGGAIHYQAERDLLISELAPPWSFA